MIIVGW